MGWHNKQWISNTLKKTVSKCTESLKNLVVPCSFIEKEIPVKYELIWFCDALEMRVTYHLRVLYMITENQYPLKNKGCPNQVSNYNLLAQLMSNVYFILSINFPVSQVICLTDSAIVMCWIQNIEKQFKLFIKNRVTKIRELMNIEL